MLDFEQKAKLRRVLYSPVVVYIMVVVALYAMYSTFSVYRKLEKSKAELEKSQTEMLALSAKSQKLDRDISELSTQSGIEREIRAKFGLGKPGENVAVIVDHDDSTITEVAAKSLSFWDKVVKFFSFK